MNIDLKITKETDILNIYNPNIISESLDSYLTSSLKNRILKDNLTITITGTNNKNLPNLIKNHYQEQYNFLKHIDNIDNYIRLILFLIGIIAILISEQFSNVLSEIFLISGWVIIWEVIYDILFNEIKRKRKAKIYKILATATFIYKESSKFN